jgi:amino acid adenylation domain-containing protein
MAMQDEVATHVEYRNDSAATQIDALALEKSTFFELEQQHVDAIVRTVPGGARNVQDIYPLAPLQEGMLFHRLLNERTDTYVLSTLFELQSKEYVGRLVDALQQVVNRHDALRSAMLWEGLPRPMQIVYRQAMLSIEELVLDPARGAIEQLKDRMRPGCQRLEVRRAPLANLHVAADPHSCKYYLLLHLHHLVCDHQSLRALVAETLAILAGRERELPQPASYRDYVAHALGSVRQEDAQRFFRSKLADIDEPTAPFGLLDVHGSGERIEEANQVLSSGLAERIRRQARRASVTPARLFHAAWALVVARTSGREDVVFGTALLASRQRRAEAPRLLGMSVNTLPLRLQLTGLSAAQLLERTHVELAELLEHGHVPLTLAQSCSTITGAAPLFTSLLNCRRSIPVGDVQAHSVAGISVLERGEAWTNYPVTMIVDDLGADFLLTAQTEREINPQRAMDYLETATRSLVEALEHAPHTEALNLEIMPQAEQQRVLQDFNETAVPYARERLIHELFEQQVQRTADEIAVVFEGECLTYAQLNARANRLARYLRARGVGPDQLVGICMERSIEMVVALLGILKAGGAYVPLDPNYPSERLEFMLNDAAPGVLLTQQALERKLRPVAVELVALDRDWSTIAEHGCENLTPESIGLRSDHLAYVIYTSGSTGRPKGAMNEHRALINRLQWMQDQYRLDVSDRVLQKTPFSFDVSVWEFFWTLMAGARLIIARPQGHQDPDYLRALIEQAQVTRLHFVPSMLQSFVANLRMGQCPSLRHVVCSGEELTASLQHQFFQRLPGVRLSNLYGPTEAAVDVTFWECRPEDRGPRVPIGRPISNTRMYVLDSRGRAVPIGITGEIYIAGAGVGRGYWNRAELTAERFVADPFSSDPQARMYRTGDLGRWRADGTIDYLGRNDDQVKIRGFRIELGEIEAQLALHEQVKEAAVIARQEATGEKRLVAYVVARADVEAQQQLTVEALREHLKAALPEYMVPSAVVVLERMPLTPSGKLDRRSLPAPDLAAYVSRQYEPPQGEIEEILAGIWQSLLRIERVGRRDNFFELGGHSLFAMQLIGRIQNSLHVTVPIRTLFEFPLLAALAQQIEQLRRANSFDDTADEAELEELLARVAAMPESAVQESLQQLRMEGAP